MATTASDGEARTRGIGQRLREGRQARGLTISQLAEATALTKGFLSQVERDLASPSVATLVKICGALDLRIGALFDAPDAQLVTKESRPQIHFGGENVEEFLLTARSSPGFQVIESLVGPGGGSGDEQYSLRPEGGFVHVISGALEIEVGDERYRLRAGDSLTFNLTEPHRWHNPLQRRSAHVLWVTSSPL